MPRRREKPRTAEVIRVSVADVRRALDPERWRTATHVVLYQYDLDQVVQLVDAPCPEMGGGWKRWLACPSCGRRAVVIGRVAGLGWGCRRCRRWKG